MHKDWNLVWSDEFNGSTIDASKWNFEVNGNGGGNNELQYYTDRAENAHLAGGHLVITAIKEKYENRNFTSARLTTKGKFSFKYGRAEARIKFPKGKGFWPAFWMMPEEAVYGGWARSGEIDIAEVVGDKPTIIHGTLHYGDKWPKNRDWKNRASCWMMPPCLVAHYLSCFCWPQGLLPLRRARLSRV